MRERRPAPAAPARCKLVLVGDVQCGKTAMLQVLAKDCYPETYVPTVFENYTACLATPGVWGGGVGPVPSRAPHPYPSPNSCPWPRAGCAASSCRGCARPRVPACRGRCRGGAGGAGTGRGRGPRTPLPPPGAGSCAGMWPPKAGARCPPPRPMASGCRAPAESARPARPAAGCAAARQLGAEGYLECSAFTSEKSVHSIFRAASGLCLSSAAPQPPRSPGRGLSKRLLHLPSRSELISSTFKKEKAKSCSVM
uniref:Rho family GTPase 1 n=1 Tax=Junco hyemalis TaxID=40217 RepID=A0A8C5IH33_JUNHY